VHRRIKRPREAAYVLVAELRAEVGPERFETDAPRYMREIWEGGLYYHWRERLAQYPGPFDP
jgi:hypothetical protein